jgi:hypothetical protein
MKPLWAVRSGNFAGWRSEDDLLYNADGKNMGHFIGDIVYSSNGFYLGEIYKDDWIGRKTNVDYPVRDTHVPRAGITDTPQPGRTGLSLEDWDDPDF